MAKLRKFAAYRNLERPYTRISKFRKKSYIKASGSNRVVAYVLGDAKKKFKYKVSLIAKESLNIRDNALEAARQSANKVLEKELGQGGYFFQIRVYPHHVLRENPLATGAGADRLSTGMSKAFGKPIGYAARVREGQEIITVRVNKNGLESAKKAVKRVLHKFPGSYTYCVKEISAKT